METDTDSVLDRVRLLEEKLESGQFVSGIMPSGTQEGAVLSPQPELPDADADDVNKIVNRFQEILINFPRKGAKAMMKSATPRVGKNGDLEIFLNPIEYNVITKDTTSLRETLNAYINETVGKKVSISYFMIESGKRNNREDNDSVDFDSVISIPVSEVED